MTDKRTRMSPDLPAVHTAHLIVPGMGSDHCAGLISSSLGRANDVSKVRTNVATHGVDVAFDAGLIDLDGIKAAVERAGYDVVRAHSDEAQRASVVRLTVPGMASDHCAGLVSASIRRLPGIADVGTHIGKHRVSVARSRARAAPRACARRHFPLSELPVEPGHTGTAPDFTLLGPLLGRRAAVDATEAVLREELGRLPSFRSFECGPVAELPLTHPLYLRTQFFRGIPSCEMLRARFRVDDCDLDGRSESGWTVVATVLPLEGPAVQTALDVVTRAVDVEGLTCRLEVSAV